MFYFTLLSNFIFGFDKYEKNYDKKRLKNKTFENKFFLLYEDELIIGYEKAKKILEKHGKENDEIICLETTTNLKLFNNHQSRVGQYIKSSKIKVNKVYLTKCIDGKVLLEQIRIEDLTSKSYIINTKEKNVKHLKPRSISILPISIGCQAKCSFCFSKYSVSTDIEKQKLDFDLINNILIKSKNSGVIRAVITGGGEPTMLKNNDLINLIKLMSSHFKSLLMITNSYKYTLMSKEDIYLKLKELKSNGLTRLGISRHHYNLEINTKLMNLKIETEKILEVYRDCENQDELPKLRLICVIQKDGVSTKKDVKKYIKWGEKYKVKEFCFKELYVSSTNESEYSSYENNDLAYNNQIPLKTVIDSCKEKKLKIKDVLPWGAPVYGNDKISVACYTEPSIGWELNNNLCRSWNIMSNGKCLASLEHLDSEIII